ncbi:MAG: hypothetical protein ACC651_02155 [Candidatus Scalindua sp.]
MSILGTTNTEQIAFKVVVDNNGTGILRKSFLAGGWQPIAENIEALGFAYAYDNDGDKMLVPVREGILYGRLIRTVTAIWI